ncbi:MAG: hypothetical protein WBP45_04190 [Daejeonella sp.]
METHIMEEIVLEQAIQKILSGDYILDDFQDILQLVSKIIA